jgi:hypothetical protein
MRSWLAVRRTAPSTPSEASADRVDFLKTRRDGGPGRSTAVLGVEVELRSAAGATQF